MPADAEPPFDVYVNGEPCREGDDFVVEGRWLRFSRPLKPQPKLGFGRKVMLAIGIGVYGDLRADTVDVGYRRAGRKELATALPIIPPQEPSPG